MTYSMYYVITNLKTGLKKFVSWANLSETKRAKIEKFYDELLGFDIEAKSLTKSEYYKLSKQNLLKMKGLKK